MLLRSITSLACSVLLTTAAFAQMGDMKADSKTMPSPPAKASVQLNGQAVTIDYNAPHMRERKIMGGLVPYGQVWRTGANPATTLKTATNLKIGTLDVPAGTYTIYTLPSADQWLLIINKQTGQWGTEYDEKQDLGRTPMLRGNAVDKAQRRPQEVMSISFENTSGASTELHIRWDLTDESVKVTAQ